MASKLLVARDLVAGHPADPVAYLRIAQARAASVGRTIREDARALVAYVNNGIWLADCPHDKSGIVLDPDWPIGACLGAGCHRVFRSIVWPDDRHGIEEALVERPLQNQHWGFLRGVSRDVNMPAETLADLARDKDERRDHFAHLRAPS